jgi:hypothetical protein
LGDKLPRGVLKCGQIRKGWLLQHAEEARRSGQHRGGFKKEALAAQSDDGFSIVIDDQQHASGALGAKLNVVPVARDGQPARPSAATSPSTTGGFVEGAVHHAAAVNLRMLVVRETDMRPDVERFHRDPVDAEPPTRHRRADPGAMMFTWHTRLDGTAFQTVAGPPIEGSEILARPARLSL